MGTVEQVMLFTKVTPQGSLCVMHTVPLFFNLNLNMHNTEKKVNRPKYSKPINPLHSTKAAPQTPLFTFKQVTPKIDMRYSIGQFNGRQLAMLTYLDGFIGDCEYYRRAALLPEEAHYQFQKMIDGLTHFRAMVEYAPL